MHTTLFTTSTITDGNMSFCVGNTQQALQNRKQFLLKHGIYFQNHICMKCNHGQRITEITWDTQSTYFGATTQENMLPSEVLITQEKGLALMLLTADCLPVSLYDPTTGTIALAHFSRETISKKLPHKTLKFMKNHFSVRPENILIRIGPHISSHSYKFPLPQPDMTQALTPFISKTSTHAHIDLVSACNTQLLSDGVLSQHISISNTDTATSPDHYSHYTSKRVSTAEGRFATVAMIQN